MSLQENNNESLVWDSIDALINELDQVVIYAAGKGIAPAADICKYVQKQIDTIKAHAMTGYRRTFAEIYAAFIDELIANGLYKEFEDYEKFRQRYFGEG